jgi:MFS superfamily sulfate permease-like transporter
MGIHLRTPLPDGIEVYRIPESLSPEVSRRLYDAFTRLPKVPRVLILRLRRLQSIDTAGASALRELLQCCGRKGTHLVLSSLQKQPREMLMQIGVKPDALMLLVADNFEAAVRLAVLILNRPTTPTLNTRSAHSGARCAQLPNRDMSSVSSLAPLLS